MAIDGKLLFAIGADQRSVICRPLTRGAAWAPFPISSSFGHLAGLAAADGKLFLSDASTQTIYQVTIRDRSTEELHRGYPLQSPTDLAFVGALFVADPSSGSIFRIKSGEPPEPLPIEPSSLLGGHLYLTGSGEDLVIAAPEAGHVYDIRRVENSSKIHWTVQRSKADTARATSGPKDLLRVLPFPEIRRPGRIALFKGILYVIDRANQTLYAVERHNPRPVRLVRSNRAGVSLVHPTSVLVTESSLYLLNGERGDVEVWPRLIPATVELKLSSVSETMANLYDYLHSRRILPTRVVALEQNIETTLRAERVLLAPYVSQLDDLLCDLNPSLCQKGQLRSLKEGERLCVPDLRSENVVDSEKIALDGKTTLGEEADQRIQSKEFDVYKSEEKLQELNTQVTRGEGNESVHLRLRQRGELYVWVEYVRYLSPILASDAPPAPSPLTTLVKKYRGLRIQAQSEKLAAASAAPPDPFDAPPWSDLRKAFERTLKVINYLESETPNLVSTYVGVAEDYVDRENPDLADAFLPPEEDEVLAQPASAGPVSVTPKVRDFENGDHGTMVSSIIGARGTSYHTRGLAPHVLMVSLHTSDAQIGEDIRRAYNQGVRIFNISAHYGTAVPTSLQDRIDVHSNALFVVAAGNNTVTGAEGPICAARSYFPACWGDRPNVLVVTGTTAAGDDLLPPLLVNGKTYPGANWSRTFVHIAAPGEGFYASGPGRSYVPARGSSFSTPMVTATAALLYAQRIVKPASIKQRLIATADPLSNLQGKVFAGLLNVRRAVANPSASVLSKTGEELVVDVERSGAIVVRPRVGSERRIPVGDVLRLHRYGTAYRVIYVDDEHLQILDGITFPTAGSSKFHYRDASGVRREGDFVDWSDYVGPAVL